ncbi:MAG: S1 RNA-binding domain-containing protein [Candidatus Bilamarchaeaceae archaeon]
MGKLPRTDEILIATVKKIMPYGVFLSLPEYGGMEAFMHVSEVAPRWIKNIHEFVSENQTLVVKAYHVDEAKGQVDVSLKRVNEADRKKKIASVRREKRAEKLLEVALKNSKSKKKIEELREEILAQYDELGDFLEDIRDSGERAFEGINAKGALQEELIALVAKYMRKSEVEVSAVISIRCFEPDGVELIRSALSGKGAHYLGAGKYLIKERGDDYKAAHKAIEKKAKAVESALRGKDCEFSVEERE